MTGPINTLVVSQKCPIHCAHTMHYVV